jgi:phosphatidylserine/phosphatidylglycerophosphate/cardiolipin synthase-like enzyme
MPQRKKGFSPIIDDSCFALLSLVQTAPPSSISYEEFKFKDILYRQHEAAYKPYFVHTSPIYGKERPIREIYEKIKVELRGVKENIRISSPYIDMYYEDIINIKLQNPNLNVRIITRPRKDIKGARERIAKNVLDLLNISIAGNLRTQELIHSRLIIIDDKWVLVSSADLTRESLVDEFNAGIFTQDEETVNTCIDYFDNIWSESDKLSQS